MIIKYRQAIKGIIQYEYSVRTVTVYDNKIVKDITVNEPVSSVEMRLRNDHMHVSIMKDNKFVGFCSTEDFEQKLTNYK
jgi:hypothetical protein